MVRSGRDVAIYVDKLKRTWQDGAAPSIYPGNARSGSELAMFRNGNGVVLDDLSIWEHAMGPNEIDAIFSRGQSPAASQRLTAPNAAFDPAQAPWGGSQPNHEQTIGLSTKLLDTASNHADLIHAFAEDSLESVYGSCYLGGDSETQKSAIARAGRSLRYLTAVEALASDITARASEIPCTGNLECTLAGAATCGATQQVCLDAAGAVFSSSPAWTDTYRESLTRFAAARARAVNAIKRLDRCENPLGIPEGDLPLYFGDVTGDNSRFFASSDYLMNTWAKPTVALAATALADARSAWQSMRQSNIQQLMNEYDAERRMEGLMQSYVRPIIDACGLSNYAPGDVLPAFARAELTPTTCFRAPRCNADSRACLRGQMGDAALAMKSAVTALRTEEHQQDRRHEEWDVQTDVCERVTRSIRGDLQAIADYKEAAKKARRKSKGIWGSVAGWLDDKFDTEFFTNAFDYIDGCLSGGQAGAQMGAAGGPPGVVAGALAGCGASINTTYAKKGIEDLEQAKEDLQNTLTQSALLREMDACWDEVGQRARDVEYGLDFTKQQLVNLEQAGQRIDEMIRATDRNVDEATAVLAREQDRTLPSVAHHFWTDEKIARYRYQLERSRRMTFLAMRAVEYELQQSLGLRSAILSATHPDQLETIVDTLDAERAARTLNGRRPASGTEVLSLRTDILGLRDLTPPHTGERADSSTQRLRQILTSPEYAMYDDSGTYLGQGVPFKLSESGALRHRCAERVWRVTATIQGDLTNVEDPGTHVFLLKNNVFQSQWCAGQGDGSDYQQASTNHTTNLFRGDETPSEEDRSEYTTAVLYPWFNVRRGEFYRDAYTEGSSEELAGRGLYGEYVLLFPYHGMLEPDGDCNPRTDASCAHPFRDLEQIEDVLIRFDYTSIDNLAH